MDLCLASHRAILKALQAFEDGELALVQAGALTLSTGEGDIRFYDGTCFAALRTELVGCELIGWLEELDDLSGVGAWWRPGVRAVLRSSRGRPLVTACSHDLSVGGLLAASGFATHTARFLVARGEKPVQPDSPAPRAPIRASNDAPPRPSNNALPLTQAHASNDAPPRPSNNALPLTQASASNDAPSRASRDIRASRAREAAETLPVADLSSGIRPVVARPEGSDTGLRARGEWRTVALVPWTLGEGRPPPRLTQPAIPANAPRLSAPTPKPRPVAELFFRRAAS